MKNHSLKITDFRFDSFPANQLFCPSENPTFSWKLQSNRPGCEQKAWQIIIRQDNGTIFADSGRVNSGISCGIKSFAPLLPSRFRGTCQLIVWDDQEQQARTEERFFVTPLFQASDWQGCWIHFSGNNPNLPSPAPFFRKSFQCTSPICHAELYAAARGVMTLSLNGRKVNRDRMMPGWTDFAKQQQYMYYDVTEHLQQGENILGAILGDGWYCSYLSGRKRNCYGKYPELLIQLEITCQDGTRHTIVSDESWQCTTGPILYSDIYDGEFYDSRLEMPGWDTIDFDSTLWQNVVPGETAATMTAQLTPKCCPPVRVVQELKPVRILHPRPDLWIWDMGQNLTGIPRIRLKGMPGLLYTIRFGEMLYPDDTLYTLNYRNARSTDYYTCKSCDFEIYEPNFTFHGFRYIQIDGFQFSCNQATAEDLEVSALVMHSDLEVTNFFQCGHTKINQLYSNICWGQKGNFLEIPTDCPQRDERLGWTGDAHIFTATAANHMNINTFFRKYLRDVREAQCSSGAVPWIAPVIFDSANCEQSWGNGSPVWGDVAIFSPWIIYQQYGDIRILEENYTMIRRWIHFQLQSCTDFIRPEIGFGDWLAFSKVSTPVSLIGTAFFAAGCRIASQIAKILKQTDDSVAFKNLSEDITRAFQKKFLDSNGLVTPATQTALALAIFFDLLPEELQERNGAALEENIRANGTRLDTGFVGTPYLNHALTKVNRNSCAFDLYLQEEFPSWLFPVNQGATTVWERWNSYTLQDGFGDVSMNSFNHYAYGAIQDWVNQSVCGIQYLTPGGKHLLLAPQPDPRLKYADFKLETMYGTVRSRWEYRSDNQLLWRFSTPANTILTVRLPQNFHCNALPENFLCNQEYELLLEI